MGVTSFIFSSKAALAVLGLGLIGYLATTVRAYLRLRAFKGPRIAGLSNFWVFSCTVRGDLNERTSEILKTNGPLARIGPNLLVTNDADLLRQMSGARSTYSRSAWYDGMRLDPRVNNVASERNDKKHNALRAKMTNGYSGKDVPGLEQSIDNRCEDLVGLIRKSYLSSENTLRKLDFAQISQYFTMDVLTDVAFGAPFGYLTKNEDLYDYIKTIRAFMPVLELQTNHPTMNALMSSPLVQALAAPTAKDRTGMGPVIAVAQKVVAKRFGEEKIENNDMLGSFVRHGLTQQECESESLLQIMAGADSTATAIRCIFLHIITNPSVYAKIRDEIFTAIKDGRISHPVIRDAEARELPYLQACIREGLRIWPPLTGLMTKLSPPEGDHFKGMFIPGNTGIAYSAWGVQRHVETYGEDVDVFRPERWLEATGETLHKMERSQELVFGSGRYGCLGKSVAFVELNKVFVQLLRNFDFTIIYPLTPMKTRCNGIFLQKDMFVRVTELVQS